MLKDRFEMGWYWVNKFKISCLIQARCGSKRFPNKMIHKIKNRTLLDWLLKRVNKSKLIDEVIIVTSNLKQDKKIMILQKKIK